MCLVRAFLALLKCYTVLKKSVSGGGKEKLGWGEGEGKIALVQVQELFELFELFSQQIFSLEFDSEIHS